MFCMKVVSALCSCLVVQLMVMTSVFLVRSPLRISSPNNFSRAFSLECQGTALCPCLQLVAHLWEYATERSFSAFTEAENLCWAPQFGRLCLAQGRVLTLLPV